MWRNAWVWGLGAGMAACVLGAAAVCAQETPPRLRGTLEQVNGDALDIKARNGADHKVQLKNDALIIACTKGSMADIKDNSFVGITATAQSDGTIKAVEVHVFDEPLRGVGEGHYPWDLMPNSTMTNAAVTHQVKKVEGNTLSLQYKEGDKNGEKTIVVPSDATVVNLVKGDKSDLKPGAKIFVPRWVKADNGQWEAGAVVVGRDGVTPPM